MGPGLFVLLVVATIVLATSIKIIKENHRAAIFRLGQFFAVLGPGVVLVLPFVDKIELIDLNRWVPEWRSLSKPDLDEKVKSVALAQPGT